MRTVVLDLAVLVAAVLSSAVHGQSYSNYPQNIPVGGLIHSGADDVKSALSYKITVDKSKNKGRAKVKLQPNLHSLDMDNNYAIAMKLCKLMNSGIYALFGTHKEDSVSLIKSYVSTFHIPYITPTMAYNETGQELGYELYLMPYYIRGLLDVCKQYGWESAHYIYNSDEGLQRLQQLFGAISEDGYALNVELQRVSSVDEAYKIMAEIDGREDATRNVLLDLSTADCDSLFNMSRHSATLLRFNFIMVGLGIGEMELEGYKANGGLNITGMSLVNLDNQVVGSFLAEWQKLSSESYVGAGREMISHQAALAVDAAGVVHAAMSRLVTNKPGLFNRKVGGMDCEVDAPDPVEPWEHGDDIMKALREITYNGLTGNVQFDKFGLRRNFELDLWEIHKSRGLKKIGDWHPRRGLRIGDPGKIRTTDPEKDPDREKTFIITSILDDPYLSLRKQPEEGGELVGNDKYEGFCADLAQAVAEQLKINYTIQVVKDGSYGSKNENGTWNGMVGELLTREADIAVAPLTINSEREQIIDFSKPFMSLGISIMIKKMAKETPGVFSFMYPLSYEIWMCVIFAYIGVSVVLFLVSRFSPFEWHIEDNTEGPTVTNNFTIFNSLWFSLGAFMQQGCDIEPRSMSGRIVGSVWWFFTLIVISSYTANLAAFLTVQRMKAPIESAEDLSKQTEIKYGTVLTGTTRQFFKQSTIPVYKRMWAFMDSTDPSVFVGSNSAGVSRVRSSDGKYAFLLESTTNDYLNQQLPCDTMKVGNNLDSKGYGIATPRGSPLRDRITLNVLQLRENGDLAKLETKWWYDKGQCMKDASASKETTNSLKLGNVAGIFYILTAGLMLALLMALAEFLYKSKMEARRRKTSFTNAVRSKARLSIKGKPERQTTAYTYAPAAQLISLDGYADGANTHTQV